MNELSCKMNPSCCFHHVEIFAEQKDVAYEFYKLLESSLNSLSKYSSAMVDPKLGITGKLEKVPELRAKWKSIIEQNGIDDISPEDFKQENQDLIEQLIVGLGFRVAGIGHSSDSVSYLLKCQKANGASYIISSPKENSSSTCKYTSKQKITEFVRAKNGRYGVSVLAFDLGDKNLEFGTNVARVYTNYKEKHGKLLCTDLIQLEFDNGKKMKYFEACAYYENDDTGDADKGTRLRFLEQETCETDGEVLLPGFKKTNPTYDVTSMDLIFDHWVSNVVNRASFLKTLEDVLGFTPKVDFNAGVVAAGKAKIESTVTGNTLDVGLEVEDDCNPQVYLPINNALSQYGHVHLFLKEIGQGVQHLASKADNLCNLMERINCYRKITGRGFTSLNIPRIYYGALEKRDLVNCLQNVGIENDSEEQALSLFNMLVNKKIISPTGIVDLDISRDDIKTIVKEQFGSKSTEEVVAALINTILTARYGNIYKLTEGIFTEKEYLSIVKNKILVDKQGYDFLLQIFTSNILQKEVKDEAPFLEFIQRKCSTKQKPRPGCGGFGIRNFLTLFLSIEVSKAMNELESLLKVVNDNDKDASEISKKINAAESKIQLFRNQLNESNPILNDLSDIMTAEAEVLETLALLKAEMKKVDEIQNKEKEAERLAKEKEDANRKLQALSEKFVVLFEELETNNS